jgi:anthranilate/para-aminobenzoate synthase component I
MPSEIQRVTLDALREVTLETWLGHALGDPDTTSRVPLRVVGLAYEAGYAGRTLAAGLEPEGGRDPQAVVATVATYPGYLVADHEEGPWEWVGDVAALQRALDFPETAPPPCPAVALSDDLGFEPYHEGVEAVLAGIASGDFYQVNLARRLEAPFPADAGPALFMAMREAQPAAFAALWSLGDGWLVSGSPECLLRWDGALRRAHTFPIKGTIKRGDGVADDRALADELATSAKNLAEHVMIVDLARNDLGRLAEVGSVAVHELYGHLELKTLRHLVSDIGATIRKDVGLAEVVGALFPGGSITGAPKIAAMKAISRLEPFARGFYCGSLGVVLGGAEAVFSILIRTAVVADGRLVYLTGGGLVSDSEAHSEWRETELKARAIENALRRGGQLMDSEMKAMIDAVIPILAVERIEDSLPFWVGRLGFVNVAEVPHGDALGFVMLKLGDLTVELQSRASIAADVPELAPLAGISTVYLKVPDIGAIEQALAGYEPIIARRDTFYGAREVIVREPSGHFVFFAQMIG